MSTDAFADWIIVSRDEYLVRVLRENAPKNFRVSCCIDFDEASRLTENQVRPVVQITDLSSGTLATDSLGELARTRCPRVLVGEAHDKGDAIELFNNGSIDRFLDTSTSDWIKSLVAFSVIPSTKQVYGTVLPPGVYAEAVEQVTRVSRLNSIDLAQLAQYPFGIRAHLDSVVSFQFQLLSSAAFMRSIDKEKQLGCTLGHVRASIRGLNDRYVPIVNGYWLFRSLKGANA